jgi:hypothetical protein
MWQHFGVLCSRDKAGATSKFKLKSGSAKTAPLEKIFLNLIHFFKVCAMKIAEFQYIKLIVDPFVKTF